MCSAHKAHVSRALDLAAQALETFPVAKDAQTGAAGVPPRAVPARELSVRFGSVQFIRS